MNEMKTLNVQQVEQVSGGWVINPVTVKVAVAVGKAVGSAAVKASTAVGAYVGYKATETYLNR